MALGLLGCGIVIFGLKLQAVGKLPALLYAPLPFLLWAAVRFGPGGLSFSYLIFALMAIFSAIAGHGPFITQSATDNVLWLQIFLLAVYLPLLVLASVVEERRTKEQALRFSEARYRAVVEDQTELICRFLPDGTYTFVNDAYCRYFQRSREELLGYSFWSFIPPEGHGAARQFLASITPEHAIATREHEVLAPDGEIRWQQWRDRGFFDDQGRVVEYQAVGRDITDRKHAEDKSSELLHDLGERVKELTALHRAARILQNEELPMPDLLQQFIAVLPPGWQYPGITAARIRLGELEFTTPNFKPTPWIQRADFSVAEGLQGAIEVVYLEERPAEQEGPFLAEERNLIDSLAEMLRTAIERKRADEMLRENETALQASYDRIQDLAGRLITAQEAERSRIASDLHDDVNQQLAGLSIALSNVKQQLQNGGDGTVQNELTLLQQRTVDLADVIRNLSHELHPGVLQHVGLAAALKGHCAEFDRQHAIEVTLSAADGLDGIPDDVALCLYRVAQEALRNVAAHAGARKAQVTLRSTDDGLELVIADDGQGFDLAEARHQEGLGLISLDERVRLVGGSLTINTEPKRGTEVRVQVPLGGNQ